MGVWIEILRTAEIIAHVTVTPYVGVWIEIGFPVQAHEYALRHPLCGGVD